jgi:L-ascorbate metabolism protein UlaG (beta-lactamase superfamily)
VTKHVRAPEVLMNQRAVGLFGLALLLLFGLGGWSTAAESLCEPGFVQLPAPRLRIVPVSAGDSPPRAVLVQWLGHSSFLVITPGGTTALTDPHSWHPPPATPDVVTVSNDHPTHNQLRMLPEHARVLKGRAPDGEWVEVNVNIGDLAIKALPSSGGNALEIPARNAIFVFRAQGLCLVHLGNLRQPLDEGQRQRLGRPDVLMVPIDGHWTLSYEQIALTISQLRPAIVLPMHYDVPEHARLFMEFIRPTVPVRTTAETTLHLTREGLPQTTEVTILRYRTGE